MPTFGQYCIFLVYSLKFLTTDKAYVEFFKQEIDISKVN